MYAFDKLLLKLHYLNLVFYLQYQLLKLTIL